jgi:hypothetical protein
MEMEEDDRSGWTIRYDAREYLQANPNPHGFAGNRFRDNQDALQFVEQLYTLGATAIYVTSIYDEDYRIEEEGGPYADALDVAMPDDLETRRRLIEVYDRECDPQAWTQVAAENLGVAELVFWWD